MVGQSQVAPAPPQASALPPSRLLITEHFLAPTLADNTLHCEFFQSTAISVTVLLSRIIPVLTHSLINGQLLSWSSKFKELVRNPNYMTFLWEPINGDYFEPVESISHTRALISP